MQFLGVAVGRSAVTTSQEYESGTEPCTRTTGTRRPVVRSATRVPLGLLADGAVHGHPLLRPMSSGFPCPQSTVFDMDLLDSAVANNVA